MPLEISIHRCFSLLRNKMSRRVQQEDVFFYSCASLRLTNCNKGPRLNTMSSFWKYDFKRMNKVSFSAAQHIPFTPHDDRLSAQLTADFTLRWYAFLMVQLALVVHFKHQIPLKIHWLDLFKYISSFEGAAILTSWAHYAYLASVPPRRSPVSVLNADFLCAGVRGQVVTQRERQRKRRSISNFTTFLPFLRRLMSPF